MTASKFLELLTSSAAIATDSTFKYNVEFDLDEDGDGEISLYVYYSEDLRTETGDYVTDECWKRFTGPGIEPCGYYDSGIMGNGHGTVTQWLTWKVDGGEVSARVTDMLLDLASGIGSLYYVAVVHLPKTLRHAGLIASDSEALDKPLMGWVGMDGATVADIREECGFATAEEAFACARHVAAYQSVHHPDDPHGHYVAVVAEQPDGTLHLVGEPVLDTRPIAA
ncbi:hypothetical protein RSWS8N_08515 [Cereibacter sphaeroides WS8N]|uniref:hypothetical protein n=1 Tax=Cereibacter sphaeroides TaxID=1063 RepID=UPI00020DFA4C|nr:hypothetical protein [Cereibacter sphaeroides]EGJ22111.1 hypothetical protein RSWS8N_08515 [Cereibacter sphaeroides WS8N]